MKNNDPISVDNIACVPWFVIEEGKDKGKVRVPTLYFIEFLGCIYYRYALINGNYKIVRIIDNVVTPVNDYAEIIEVASQWLEDNATGGLIAGIYIDEILSAWINKTTHLFSPLNLKFLPKIEIKPHFDTADTSYFYFKDTALKITANGCELIAYQDLDGQVFAEQIIDRSF